MPQLQETSDQHDTVLATFETSAKELLFPYPQLRGPYCAGVDVDLLMEPTNDFPGIISPKVSEMWMDRYLNFWKFYNSQFIF